jgi:hypothetical protein
MRLQALVMVFVLATAACAPTGYFVANVYRDGNDLYLERCPIYDSPKSASRLDSGDCKYEKVASLPPAAKAALESGH